ncbi:MAG: hypothetical protein LBJ97_00290 [Mycoplasmataceae bacterium]|jgi:hypothetical protein|nr:hypothetical protein [Mycoplasmataceae bacterium]
MSKVDRINYDESLVIRLVANIVSKVPGVDVNDNFNVTINEKHTVLGIIFKPLPDVLNVFQIARKVQETVYYNVKKTFDLYNITINVVIDGDK